MPQPFSNATNMTTIIDIFEYGNTVTDGGSRLLGAAMVMVVWLVAWAAFSGRYERVTKPMMASSFIAFLFGAILDIPGLVPQYAVVLPFSALLIALVADKVIEED